VSESSEKFGWVKRQYDRILVIGVLLTLIGSALYLSLRLDQDSKELELQIGQATRTSRHEVKPLNTEEWAERQQMRVSPFQTGAITNWLFTSELRVRCVNEECQLPIPYDATNCPFCAVEQPDVAPLIDSDGDRVPDELEKEYGLDPFDPTDVQKDIDGDGFTVLEEFDLTKNTWISDPRDADSYPPPVAKIRLYRLAITPFKMQFRGVQDLPGGKRYQLNMGGRSKFAKMDEVIPVTTKNGVEEYQVTGYEEHERQEGNRTIDESVLLLESGGETFRLIKNKPVTRQDKLALLLSLLEKTPLKGRIGDNISLKGYTYKVIDISGEGVLLEDTQTGVQTLAPRITEAEILQLKQAAKTDRDAVQ
jgi:hypothetical protein